MGPGGIFIDGRAMSRTEHSGSVAGSPGQRECESVTAGPKPAGARLPSRTTLAPLVHRLSK